MKSKIRAPGLVARKSQNGVRYYWIASNCVRDTMGFEPPTVRLHYDTDEERTERCRRLKAELDEWIHRRKNPDKNIRPKLEKVRFSGTLASMIDIYELHELSPFHDLAPKSQRVYLAQMAVLRKRIGDRTLARVSGEDLLQWHRKFIEASRSEKYDGLRWAHALMTMLRNILRFGTQLGMDEPARLTAMLREMRFKNAKPRKTVLTFEHASAVIAEANKQGRGSIALAQALQFELTLRQYDVIGQWEPIPKGTEQSGIVYNGKVWRKGLTWNQIDENMILTITTNKNAVLVEFDLKDYPLLMAEIERVPVGRRLGPMVINENTGRPYSMDYYPRVWRKIARVAGVPDHVWNRDSRAGGITEATDAASQDIEHVRIMAQHSDSKTTQRYSRSSKHKTSNVARLRMDHRATKNGS